jgi:hypothetical protein
VLWSSVIWLRHNVFYYTVSICWDRDMLYLWNVFWMLVVQLLFDSVPDFLNQVIEQYAFWSVLMCSYRQTIHMNAIMLLYTVFKMYVTERFSFTVTIIVQCKPLNGNHLYMIFRISGYKKWNSFYRFALHFLKIACIIEWSKYVYHCLCWLAPFKEVFP